MRIVVLLDETTDLRRLESRRGHWSWWFDAHVIDALRGCGHEVSPVVFGGDLAELLATFRQLAPEVVFNLTEGVQGDRGADAYPTALLELLGLPYTGATPRGRVLAGDKALSKTILRAHGIDVPDFQVMTGWRRGGAVPRFPVLVKPLNRGGSEGLTPASLVRDAKALRRQVERLRDEHGCPAICEEYVAGRELSVGLLGDRRPRVLQPGEWQFGRGAPFITEKLKWDLAYADRVGTTFATASLPPALARRVADVCRRAYRLLELRDYGSIDLRVTAENRVVLLEANANPGLFPGSVRFRQVPFPRLVDGIVRAARRRGRRTASL